MKKQKICAFSGHRKIESTEEFQTKVKIEILKLIDNGVTVFLNGGALGFDMLCAKTVIELREIFKDIKLHLLLPCRDQSDRWSSFNRRMYEEILEKSNGIYYVSEKYEPGCMQKRNRILVDNCDCLLTYLAKSSGGTYYTVKYAEKTGKQIININEQK